MANYSLVVGSKFNPFTYEELAAPLREQTLAHQQIENEYSDLSTKANIWDEMANEQTDPIAHAQYKKYANDLRIQADTLAREGLNATSRQSMLNMKQRYAKEITPIEVAYKKREDLRKEQRDILKTDPTRMFQRNLNAPGVESSLDRFIEDANYGYGEQYSGELLRQQVSKEAAAVAKELKSNTQAGANLRKRLQQILPYQYRILEQTGFKSEDVFNTIMSNENASPILQSMVDRALDASGISSWASEDIMREARNYGNLGLWDAVGTTTPKYLKDDYNLALELERRKGKGNTPTSVNLPPLNPLNIYSTREQDKASDYIKRFSKYFTEKNGKLELNEKGLEAYRALREGMYKYKNAADLLHDAGQSPKASVVSEFREFIDSLGGAQYIGDASKDIKKNGKIVHNWMPGSVGNLWQKYKDEYGKSSLYDTHKATEFEHLYDDSDKAKLKEILTTRSTSENLQVQDYNPKTDSFENIGKISKADFLDNSKYSLVSSRYYTSDKDDRTYATIIATDLSTGKPVRIKMEAGMGSTNERNRDARAAEANRYKKALQSGYMEWIDENGRTVKIPLNEESREQLKNMYKWKRAAAEHEHSLIGQQTTLVTPFKVLAGGI